MAGTSRDGEFSASRYGQAGGPGVNNGRDTQGFETALQLCGLCRNGTGLRGRTCVSGSNLSATHWATLVNSPNILEPQFPHL